MKAIITALLILTIVSISPAASPSQTETGVAQTPPMGWMTWNTFEGNISEALIKEMADAMVSTGMADAGYRYIIIDDLWQGSRDANGNLRPDPKKFPSGIKALADYVHSKGLKLGIYSDAAGKTCAGAVGSYGYEEQDAFLFAGWGIDYLKYDYCNAPADRGTAFKRYKAMADAIKKTGRSMVFAVCEWGVREPWLWAAKAGGHVWRTTFDIRDTWNHGKYDSRHNGIMNMLDRQVGLEKFAGPGRWNDPDMLVVGLYGKGKPSSHSGAEGCTDTEYRSNMSLWCLLAAPLIASNDLRNMNKVTLGILTNKEAIAVNQDPLGKQATRVLKRGDIEVWAKALSGGAKAVGVLNRNDNEAKSFTLQWSLLEMSGNQKVRHLWMHKDLGIFKKNISLRIKPHETVLLKISRF